MPNPDAYPPPCRRQICRAIAADAVALSEGLMHAEALAYEAASLPWWAFGRRRRVVAELLEHLTDHPEEPETDG